MSGKIVVIAGPSGVGKTTLCNRLLESNDFSRIITATTRAPRDGEIDGVHYHFLTHEEFERRKNLDFFLETATVHKNSYGTPLDAVEDALEAGKSVLLVVDIQGAESIIDRIVSHNLITIFLMPPSFRVLETRLRNRSTEEEAVIQQRLNKAREEVTHWTIFDHIIINDDVESSAQKIQKLLRESK